MKFLISFFDASLADTFEPYKYAQALTEKPRASFKHVSVTEFA
jgi:hypothetical protein